MVFFFTKKNEQKKLELVGIGYSYSVFIVAYFSVNWKYGSLLLYQLAKLSQRACVCFLNCLTLYMSCLMALW